MTGKKGHSGRKPERRPSVAAARPIAPAWLDEESREWFDKIVDLVDPDGTRLAAMDCMPVAMLASAIKDYIKAEQLIAEQGEIVQGKTGPYINPAMNMKFNSDKRIQKYLAELGATPRARHQQRVKTGDVQQDNAFTRFLKLNAEAG